MDKPKHKHLRSHRRTLYIVLFAVALVSLLTATVLSLLLLQRREDFRKASDYTFVKELLDQTEASDLYEILRPFVERERTVYEDEEAVREHLLTQLAPELITFSHADSHTADAPAYILYANGKETFLLTLSGKRTASGHPHWEVNSFSVSPQCALGNVVRVEVPHGALLTVNGIELAATQASRTDYHALTEFEKHLTDRIYCDSYAIGRFFLTPDITAVLDSYRLRAESVSGETLRFGYPSSYTSTVTLTVPYGAAITVNGIPVGTRYLTESGITYPHLTRFEAELPNLITAGVYQITDLFEEPTVVVTSGGVTLTADDNNAYRLPDNMTQSIVIAAPSYATVKINGVSLGASEISAENVEMPIGEGVTGFAMDRTRLTEYTVTGLLTAPVITATDANGFSLTPSPYYSANGRLLFACSPGGAVPSKEQLTLRTFARLYVHFIYSATNGQSANYRNCTDMTPSKSLAYSSLRTTFYTLYDAPVHRNLKYGTVEFLSYYPYSKSTMSAIVKIPFTSTLNGQALRHEVTMEILYIYSGAIRRIVNYKVLDTVTESE